ncbi:MAG TPA: type II secretion system protein GspJ [Myxococcota bacterium]|nr:type II secretion system protein GspJ [Myxococcota bacterium]
MKTSRRNVHGLLGFTLIEIMVASLLLGFMGILLTASIRSSIKAKDTLEDISSRDQMVRQAMSRMAREISMAYLSKHFNHGDPAYLTQFKGHKDRLFFSAFGHVVHQRDAKQSDQQVLGFYLAPDKNGQQALMRRMRANLNLDVEKGGVAQVLCPHVTKLEFAYFDEEMNKWEESWSVDSRTLSGEGQNLAQEKKPTEGQEAKPKVPAGKRSRLPSYVKISLTANMGEGSEMTWITETEIPIQMPLDLY